MIKEPLVSIIIPCYNVENYIEDTIKSVLNQYYKNMEIIIIDDGSIDNTKQKVKKFISDERIKYYYQKNKGVSASRNFGIEKANGEYICFLDGDDLYLPYKVLKQIDRLMNSRFDVCYCGTSVTKLNDKNSINKRNVYNKNGKIIEDFILQKAYITTNDWMIKKSFIDKNNLRFNERYKYGEDFNFFLKVLTLSEAISVDEILTIYRVNNNSSSFKEKIRINQQDNFISEYIKWIKYKDGLIYSKKEVENIIFLLKSFLMPQVFIRNIDFNNNTKRCLNDFEIDVLKSFKFNIKNIKSSIKYYYLYMKIYIRLKIMR